jgi:hypothetical protein
MVHISVERAGGFLDGSLPLKERAWFANEVRLALMEKWPRGRQCGDIASVAADASCECEQVLGRLRLL